MKGGGQVDTLPEKAILKKSSLIRVENERAFRMK